MALKFRKHPKQSRCGLQCAWGDALAGFDAPIREFVRIGLTRDQARSRIPGPRLVRQLSNQITPRSVVRVTAATSFMIAPGLLPARLPAGHRSQGRGRLREYIRRRCWEVDIPTIDAAIEERLDRRQWQLARLIARPVSIRLQRPHTLSPGASPMLSPASTRPCAASELHSCASGFGTSLGPCGRLGELGVSVGDQGICGRRRAFSGAQGVRGHSDRTACAAQARRRDRGLRRGGDGSRTGDAEWASEEIGMASIDALVAERWRSWARSRRRS